MRTVSFLVVAFLWSAAASAAGDLESGGFGVVGDVVDGDTAILEQPIEGAIQIRLVGIQAPKLPLGRPAFRAWPLAAQAKAALEALVLGKPVELRFGGRRLDRHGRLLAHLYGADGAWVQGALLAGGMARVYSFPDNRARVPEMLALERAARAARRGIWGHRFYGIRTPGDVARDTGTFQIVEGTVLAAAKVKGRVYLNFGPDWHTDFTVSVDSPARRLFRQLGFDPLALEGRRLRVRGWIRKFNGPLIEATHPEQIEVLAR